MTDNAFVLSFSTEGGRGEAGEKADAYGRKGRGSGGGGRWWRQRFVISILRQEKRYAYLKASETEVSSWQVGSVNRFLSQQA